MPIRMPVRISYPPTRSAVLVGGSAGNMRGIAYHMPPGVGNLTAHKALPLARWYNDLGIMIQEERDGFALPGAASDTSWCSLDKEERPCYAQRAGNSCCLSCSPCC